MGGNPHPDLSLFWQRIKGQTRASDAHKKVGGTEGVGASRELSGQADPCCQKGGYTVYYCGFCGGECRQSQRTTVPY